MKVLLATILVAHLYFVWADADAEPGWKRYLVKRRLSPDSEDQWRSGRALVTDQFPFAHQASLPRPDTAQQNPLRARGASSARPQSSLPQRFSQQQQHQRFVSPQPSFDQPQPSFGQRQNQPRFVPPQQQQQQQQQPRFVQPQREQEPRFVQPQREQEPRFVQPRQQPRFLQQQEPRFVQPQPKQEPRFVQQQQPRFSQPQEPGFVQQQQPRFLQPQHQQHRLVLQHEEKQPRFPQQPQLRIESHHEEKQPRFSHQPQLRIEPHHEHQLQRQIQLKAISLAQDRRPHVPPPPQHAAVVHHDHEEGGNLASALARHAQALRAHEAQIQAHLSATGGGHHVHLPPVNVRQGAPHPPPPINVGVLAAAPEQCVEKIVVVEEIEYEDQIDCKHSYDKKCHTTYTTDYEPQQEEECEENFKKDCFIEYKKVAHNESVEFCHTPLVKDCNLPGPVECRTEYEAECSTKYHEHKVVDDIPECRTVKEFKCKTVQRGYKPQEEDCTEWPVEKCTVRMELVKKVTPETKCTKVPKKVCAPAGCGFVQGIPECLDKKETIIQEVPEETCELSPQKHCKHVTKLVPNLKPHEECVDVPKEVCVKGKSVPRKVQKPLVKKWCYTPKPRLV